MWRDHQIVAAPQQFVAQPVFHNFADQPALGMPKDKSGPGFFLNAEKIELHSQLAMVTALGLFEAMQIFVEFFLSIKSRGINAL